MNRSNMTTYEKEVYQHAVSAYSFVIQDIEVSSLNQFADEIEKVYDKNNPQTKEVCRVLRKYSD